MKQDFLRAYIYLFSVTEKIAAEVFDHSPEAYKKAVIDSYKRTRKGARK
jgi:hypothetical protein